MKQLLLIRHAETDLAGTFCGHSDPPLNAAGLAQVQRLLPLLSDAPPDAVFTSDLLRAVETADPIARFFNIPCSHRAALREIDFGRWEGLRWSEIEALDPGYAASWVQAFPSMPTPGGERFKDFESRVLDAVHAIVEETASASVALVTHAGVMRTILRQRAGIDDEQAWRLTKPYCAALRVTTNACEVLA